VLATRRGRPRNPVIRPTHNRRTPVMRRTPVTRPTHNSRTPVTRRTPVSSLIRASSRTPDSNSRTQDSLAQRPTGRSRTPVSSRTRARLRS
jgi:hypothetical protein